MLRGVYCGTVLGGLTTTGPSLPPSSYRRLGILALLPHSSARRCSHVYGEWRAVLENILQGPHRVPLLSVEEDTCTLLL